MKKSNVLSETKNSLLNVIIDKLRFSHVDVKKSEKILAIASCVDCPIDILFNFLNDLGMDVHIIIKSQSLHKKGSIKVY